MNNLPQAQTNGNDSAFASANPEADGQCGLTKREYIAIHTLAALLTNTDLDNIYEHPPFVAVEYADALIDALNRERDF